MRTLPRVFIFWWKATPASKKGQDHYLHNLSKTDVVLDFFWMVPCILNSTLTGRSYLQRFHVSTLFFTATSQNPEVFASFADFKIVQRFQNVIIRELKNQINSRILSRKWKSSNAICGNSKKVRNWTNSKFDSSNRNLCDIFLKFAFRYQT